MRKEDLPVTGFTTNRIADMGKGERISMEMLTRIRGEWVCDISDVIELEQEENSKSNVRQ